MPEKTTYGPEDIATSHWVKFNTGDNRICYTLTGIFRVALSGYHGDIFLSMPIPALPQGQGFAVENWAPLFTLSEIIGQSWDPSSQVFIPEFSITDFDLKDLPTPNRGAIALNFRISVVTNNLSVIAGIGYSATLVGILKPL